MTDRRDRLVKHTPVAGVSSQLAAVPGEIDGPETTGVTPIPPSGETAVEAINRRTQETKNTTLTTLDRVETMRRENREDIKAVNARVDKVVEVVSLVRVEVAGSAKQNELIIKMLDEQNKARQLHEETTAHLRTTTMTAEVEVTKTRALSAIEVEKTSKLADIEAIKAARELKRDIIKRFTLKAIGVAAVAATAALGGGLAFRSCL